MPLFPFFMDISEQEGLLIGGGRKALRKAEKLAAYTDRLHVIAAEPLPELEELIRKHGWKLSGREFREGDLEGQPAYVILADGDREENRRIAVRCREMRVPVNVVDDPRYCSFIFPSLIARGDLSVGISTGGASPVAAMLLREQMEAVLPENIEEILAWLEEQKQQLRQQIPEEGCRSRVMRRVVAESFRLGRPLTEAELQMCDNDSE